MEILQKGKFISLTCAQHGYLNGPIGYPGDRGAAGHKGSDGQGKSRKGDGALGKNGHALPPGTNGSTGAYGYAGEEGDPGHAGT